MEDRRGKGRERGGGIRTEMIHLPGTAVEDGKRSDEATNDAGRT